MKIGIENSNTKGGGGNTYLFELLRHANPVEDGFESIVLWSTPNVLKTIENHPWLKKIPAPFNSTALNSLSHLYQDFGEKEKCDVLFAPGGTYLGRFRPFVVMAQNMLPFESKESHRYTSAAWRLKFFLLRHLQLYTFRQSNGLIYISNNSQGKITKLLHSDSLSTKIIHHGINEDFRQQPRPQKNIESFSSEHPIKVLYVSPVAPYKHQWNVINAMGELRQKGYPIELELAGGKRNKVREFDQAIKKFDPENQWTKLTEAVPYEEMAAIYTHGDIFVFASSCESFSMITLEAMSAGLPIACSNKGAMPELLGDGAIFFNPEDPREIAQAVEKLILSPKFRETIAWKVYIRAKEFSWDRCARETFQFISKVKQEFGKQAG
jgi:glycosyltransferase involved in cell wall biosynthesis